LFTALFALGIAAESLQHKMPIFLGTKSDQRKLFCVLRKWHFGRGLGLKSPYNAQKKSQPNDWDLEIFSI